MSKTPSSAPLSPAPTLINGRPQPVYSPIRRYGLLVIFCLAQFLDTFNISSLFSAIPQLSAELGITANESAWVLGAFQLTFAAFLLIAGKISDLYNPKYTFIIGAFVLGVLNLIAGFIRNKIVLIVLRALAGIPASLTIPSGLTLLVKLFPRPDEQARALSAYGGSGALGNVMGLVIGAIFVQFASWPWVFWFVPLISIPIALICLWLIPAFEREQDQTATFTGPKWKRLDIIGVATLTSAIVLFIFAVTSGSADGWGSATVVAPLVISIVLFVAFFVYETRIPEGIAAIPPKTWFLPNFSIIFAIALLPYFWWVTVFTIFTTYWQEIYHWSVITAALRMLPLGTIAFAVSFTTPLFKRISPKWVLTAALLLNVIATVLLRFANTPDRYWSYNFPAFIIGTTGSMLMFTQANIAIFRTSPPSMSGTVGAIFNGALQLGSAVGLAAVTSIQTSIDQQNNDPNSFKGRAAAYWFILAVVIAVLIGLLVFYDVKAEGSHQEQMEEEVVEEKKRRSSDEESQTVSVNRIDDLKKDEEMKEDGEVVVAPISQGPTEMMCQKRMRDGALSPCPTAVEEEEGQNN